MNPILKKSVTALARESIQNALVEGRWSGRIPSTRMLCETLQISPHTLGKALESLVADGVLVSDGPKRRLRVAGSANPPPLPEPPARKVLCLGRDPLHLMPRIGLEFLSHLRGWLPGMDLRYHGVSFDKCRKPRRAWIRLLELERPDHLLVLEGSEEAAEWAAACGVPAVFLGGALGKAVIPAVGAGPGRLMQLVLGELIAMGHQRICMPLFGQNAVFAGALRERFSDVFAAAGLPFLPNYHVPAAASIAPDVVTRVMDKLAATKMPTALIFLMWEEFLTAQCHFLAHGLRIPEKISVVLMAGGDFSSWYRPTLTHLVYPAEEAAKTVAQWIADGPPAANSMVMLPMRLVRGDSVAPPPAR
jgi:DNA-binding LacI/PurR family transcriptional regulator